jgi:UDP-2,4-diacetamido-2,4,6-trideoxy-beta-L-altropyranose hydrolase
MNVAVRVDGSPSIGMGHVMRTIALARRLRTRGASVTFISRERGGTAFDVVRANGFAFVPLSGEGLDESRSFWLGVPPERDAAETQRALATLAPCDWLIADNYGIDERWERRLRPAARALFAFDDLADRPHDVDALLDQNVLERRDGRYRALVPPGARVFLGPHYAPLRDEFLTAGRTPRARDGRIRAVLVAFGSDPGAHTLLALDALARCAAELTVTVVAAAAESRIDALVARHGWARFERVDDMAARLAAADLAIGAGGTSAWERAYLGVPAIAWAIAENQREPVAGLLRAGAIASLDEPDPAALAALIDALRADPGRVRAMGAAAHAIMEGHARASDELDTFLLQSGPVAAA